MSGGGNKGAPRGGYTSSRGQSKETRRPEGVRRTGGGARGGIASGLGSNGRNAISSLEDSIFDAIQNTERGNGRKPGSRKNSGGLRGSQNSSRRSGQPNSFSSSQNRSRNKNDAGIRRQTLKGNGNKGSGSLFINSR